MDEGAEKRGGAVSRALRGWAGGILISLATTVLLVSVVEVGCWLWLRSLRGEFAHPVYYLLEGMVNNFHPLFNPSGHFTASNYYPYIGNYWEGDWSKTPKPHPEYPDAWVLPLHHEPGEPQRYSAPAKEPGVLRIVALGGSTMAGFGQSSQAKSIPATMERLLKEAYPDRKIEVINGAFYVHIAAQELVTLETKLILWQPDVVVVLDGYNEFIRVYHMPQIPPFWSHSHESIYRAYPRVQSFKGVVSQLAFLVSKRFYSLAILRALRYNKRFLPGEAAVASGKADPAPFERAVREYLLVHRMFLGLSQSLGFKLVMAAQPSLPYAKPPTAVEKDYLEHWQKEKPLYRESAAVYWPLLDSTYTAFTKEAGSRKASVLNLTRFFEHEDQTVFSDVCHYTDLGAEKLARRLARESAAALGLPPRPL